MPARTLPTGIRRTPTGYQSYVWVVDESKPKGGYQAAKRWPPDTALAEMKAWRMKAKLGVLEDDEQPAVRFAEEARDYLTREKVRAMPTSKERVQHIEEWIRVFGKRIRSEIQPQEIQRALDGLKARLSAGSVNKRRTALMDLWTTVDGRHQANPVKATTVYPEPEPEPRAPALVHVLTVLATIPATTDYGRKCRARLMVITWTGWPHAIIKQLEESDRQFWKAGQAFVKRRRKGKGSRARWLPLLPQAVEALKEFHKADAYGHFSNSPLWKRVNETCIAQKLPHIRPYDFRHFFGTLVATITKDERAVQELMLLSTAKQARRYTAAATDPRVQAAVSTVAAKLPRLLKGVARLQRGVGQVKLAAGKMPRLLKKAAAFGATKPSRPQESRTGISSMPDTRRGRARRRTPETLSA